jgi:hypothetical protein
MLSLNGESFTQGSQPYEFRPAIASDSSKRVMLDVDIEGRRTLAMLDTGAPFMICAPSIASSLGLDPNAAIDPTTLVVRGSRVEGALHRLNVTIRAEQGNELTINATAFVPSQTADWPGIPSILGLEGCLEWVRFALDTSADTFYFGSHP